MSTTSRLLDEPVPTARATTRDSVPSGYVNSTSTMAKGLGNPSDRFGPDDQRAVVPKDEDDALLDEDMAEDEADSLLQTAAERVAARRKMKRFR